MRMASQTKKLIMKHLPVISGSNYGLKVNQNVVDCVLYPLGGNCQQNSFNMRKMFRRKRNPQRSIIPRCGLMEGRMDQRISSLPVVMSFPLFRSKIIILSDSTDKLTVEPILKLRSPKTTPVRRKSPTLTLIVDSIPVGMAP